MQAQIPYKLEFSQNPMQVKKEEHKTCAHILWELNMQAQIPYKLEFLHISFRSWTCKHIILISHTYPMGIEHVSPIEEVEIEMETKVTPRQEPY